MLMKLSVIYGLFVIQQLCDTIYRKKETQGNNRPYKPRENFHPLHPALRGLPF